jgi:hypothetical protein
MEATLEQVETIEPQRTDLLDQISNAELVCRQREARVDILKEDLKEAKAALDCAVSKLRELATQAVNDADRPLFSQGEESASDEPSDLWQDVSIEVLLKPEIKGLGAKKIESLIDSVSTLGGLEQLRCLVGKDADHLADLLPKGIGEAMADELETRHLEYIANFSQESEPEVPNLDEFKAQLLERVEELKQQENWLGSREDESVAELGEQAFEQGQPITDCPFDFETAKLDDWLRGYYAGAAVAEFESGENPGDEYDEVDVEDL